MRAKKYRLMPMPMATRGRLARATARLVNAEAAVDAHMKKEPEILKEYGKPCADGAKILPSIEKEDARYSAERERFEREGKAREKAMLRREQLKAAWKDPETVQVPEVRGIDGDVERAWIEVLDVTAATAHVMHAALLRLTAWQERRGALLRELAAARNEFTAAIEEYDKARNAETEAAENVAREEKEIREEEEAEAREAFAAAEAKMKELGLHQ